GARGRRGPARRRRAAGDPARAGGREGNGARGAGGGAAADRGGRVLRLPARRARGARGRRPAARGGRRGRAGGGERRARPRQRAPASDRRDVHSRHRPRESTYPCRSRLLRPRLNPLQLDVFTLVPHAYAWLTEQRPVATVLGSELDLRLFSYRDTTPLRSGQVDDEPYGGGAGMVLRVDVVAAALDSVYGGQPTHRVVALTPQGRQLTQEIVEELAKEERLTLLSARFEGFDERVLAHLASDSISIGPYVLSGGELPAMVVVDAVARRLPGALGSAESGLIESFSAELEGGLEYPHYTRPADFRGWRVPEVLLSGDHAKIDEWRRRQSRLRTAG